MRSMKKHDVHITEPTCAFQKCSRISGITFQKCSGISGKNVETRSGKQKKNAIEKKVFEASEKKWWKRDKTKHKTQNHFPKVFEAFKKKWSKRNRKNRKNKIHEKKNELSDTLIFKVNFSQGEKLDYGPTRANY